MWGSRFSTRTWAGCFEHPLVCFWAASTCLQVILSGGFFTMTAFRICRESTTTPYQPLPFFSQSVSVWYLWAQAFLLPVFPLVVFLHVHLRRSRERGNRRVRIGAVTKKWQKDDNSWEIPSTFSCLLPCSISFSISVRGGRFGWWTFHVDAMHCAALVRQSGIMRRARHALARYDGWMW